MARKAKKPAPLRWRPNNIRLWRKHRGYTLDDVADHLASLGNDDLIRTRNSLGRYESGLEVPNTDILEAIAKFLKTDVTTMLDMTPEEGEDIREFRAMKPTERRRMLHSYRVARGDGE